MYLLVLNYFFFFLFTKIPFVNTDHNNNIDVNQFK